jgi:chromosome segregation ATPase
MKIIQKLLGLDKLLPELNKKFQTLADIESKLARTMLRYDVYAKRAESVHEEIKALESKNRYLKNKEEKINSLSRSVASDADRIINGWEDLIEKEKEVDAKISSLENLRARIIPREIKLKSDQHDVQKILKELKNRQIQIDILEKKYQKYQKAEKCIHNCETDTNPPLLKDEDLVTIMNRNRRNPGFIPDEYYDRES